MWLFSKLGLFSIVAHRDAPTAVLIRARVKQDLKELQAVVKEVARHTPPIRSTPQADYPYRMQLERVDFARVVYHLVIHHLDYPNFKSAIAEQSHARAYAYHDVWATLLDLEERVSPPPRPRLLPTRAVPARRAR